MRSTGIEANGLICISCDQRKSNMQIALAFSSGPNLRIHWLLGSSASLPPAAVSE